MHTISIMQQAHAQKTFAADACFQYTSPFGDTIRFTVIPLVRIQQIMYYVLASFSQ
jgi:hypothetical protein